jgi:hypothetical protein
MNEIRLFNVLSLLGSTSFWQKTGQSLKTLSSPAPNRKWAFAMSACQFSQAPRSIDGLTSLLVPIPEHHASGVHAIPLSQTPNVYMDAGSAVEIDPWLGLGAPLPKTSKGCCRWMT